MYPAMDGRKEIVIKANGGEVVTAEPGFFVVAGHNPGVHGAILSDALSSRFAFQVSVGSDFDLAGQLGVDPQAVKVARNLATRKDAGEIGWAPYVGSVVMPHSCVSPWASESRRVLATRMCGRGKAFRSLGQNGVPWTMWSWSSRCGGVGSRVSRRR
jgi:hypothetical protein